MSRYQKFMALATLIWELENVKLVDLKVLLESSKKR